MRTKLIIAGGGTGGHLFPGIAVAEALLELEDTAEVLFVGTKRGIERTAVPGAGFKLATIDVSGLNRVGLKQMLTTLAGLPNAHLKSARILRDFGATAVLGVGGYASGPLVMTARVLGIPSAICEQNSVPGLTNRILGRVVERVFASFPSSSPYFPTARFELVGNPVRRSFRAAAANESAAAEPGLVFTFGGSQGARPLNEAVPAALGLLVQRGCAVRALHQTGKVDGDGVSAAYAGASVPAEVTPFIDDMVSAYQRAQVVICRAGATSCAELTALGIPAILIPFPEAADDHQTKNAADLVKSGAAIAIPQSEMTPERLANEIEGLIVDQERRGQMADAARRMGRLKAAFRVAEAAQSGFNLKNAAVRSRQQVTS